MSSLQCQSGLSSFEVKQTYPYNHSMMPIRLVRRPERLQNVDEVALPVFEILDRRDFACITRSAEIVTTSLGLRVYVSKIVNCYQTVTDLELP